MKNVRFHDSKLKFAKALLLRLFHETETPAACRCSLSLLFICGRLPDLHQTLRPISHFGEGFQDENFKFRVFSS